METQTEARASEAPELGEDAVRVSKGDRVRAEWMRAKAVGTFSLAGVQVKFPGTQESVVGTIRHLRTCNPEAPTDVVAFLDVEGDWEGPRFRPAGCRCEQMHVPVRAAWILEVLPKDG